MFLYGIKLKGTKMANKLFIQSIEDFDRSKQSKNLDLQSYKYERFVFIDDFNKGMENEAMKDFCNLYRLTNLNNKLVTKILQIRLALTLYKQIVLITFIIPL